MSTKIHRAPSPHSQTLSRGIRVLEVLADADGPVSIAALAAELDVHRSIVYRLLRTLEDHRLVRRDTTGVELGIGLVDLAHGVARDLRAVSMHELTAAANELAMTAYVSVLDAGECVTLLSAEPINESTTIAYKPGARHPISAGADGVAMQMQLDEDQLVGEAAEPWQRSRRAEALARGYAESLGEVVRGLRAIAVPLVVPHRPPAAIAAVYVESELPTDQIGARLATAARNIADKMR